MNNYQNAGNNKFHFETSTNLYEEMQKTDLIKLEVELSDKIIIFSINWVDHDLSIAGITIEQAKKLVDKLTEMIDKVQYDEAVEYYKLHKKMKLQRKNKDE